MKQKKHKTQIIIIILALICTIPFTIKTSHAEEDYNYLAIGNSLTFHAAIENLWWSNCGMAASSPEHDYVHLVTNYLKDLHGSVSTDIFQDVWETDVDHRSDVLEHLETVLKAKNYNLITIEWGENLQTTDHLEKDFLDLIDVCQKYAPSARIIIVGNFWAYRGAVHQDSDAIKSKVAQAKGCGFANLTEVKDDPTYQLGFKAAVNGEDGMTHVTDNLAVSIHPNDKGMAYIADKIEKQIDPASEFNPDTTITPPSLSESQIQLTVGESKQLLLVNPIGNISYSKNSDVISLSDESAQGVTVTGNEAGTASVMVSMGARILSCDVIVSEPEKTETVAHVHDWDEGTVTTEPTCVTSGIKTYTCRTCGASYTETIPATGIHHWETVNGTSATTKANGLTAGTRCSVCGMWQTPQQVILKLKTVKKKSQKKLKLVKPQRVSKVTTRQSKKKITIRWRRLKNVTEYQVAFRKVKGKKTYKWTIKTVKVPSYSTRKAKKVKYQIKVRGINGSRYGSWSKVKKVSISKK